MKPDTKIDYPNDRDCVHGSQRRTCSLREDAKRITELESSLAAKTAECERLRMVSTLAEGLRDAFEHVIAEAENVASGRRGMQVPFHGDFAAAVQLPSLVSTMRWWERELRAALAG